ncbi:hypothetical protein HGRIS_014851 [Hohenbuehelia grisea]|uniref:Uncharacterized protein n=1 Tax=Hohenbuehelia grisea TaxID=104357 RepID=A0ABR3IQX4_9AGAR
MSSRSSSTSSQSSRSGSPIPQLDPSTLAILGSFYADKAEEEQIFNDLAQRSKWSQYVDDEKPDEQESSIQHPKMISVDEFRVGFREDWQLSQFWYSTKFAYKLAKCIHHLCSTSNRIDGVVQAGPTTEPTIAFVCCPTSFVAFTNLYPPSPGDDLKYTALLMEHDQRFSYLPLSTRRTRYIPYDLTDPTKIPADIVGKVDLVVVDPPFLNLRTNEQVATTLRRILRTDTGKLIIITSTSLEGEEPAERNKSPLHIVYNSAPIGPLRRTQLNVEHVGLQNDFACWGSWDGAESFGHIEE